MGKAGFSIRLESDVEWLACQVGAGQLTTADLIRRMDAIVSAARVIVARRLEREAFPTHHGAVDSAFHTVEDPGLYAINQSILAIAERAGVKPDEAPPSKFDEWWAMPPNETEEESDA